MKSAPKFSIVMIAKNEEKTLPRCMESLKDFRERGGEIILCDTGSTDKTVNIAHSFGCVVTEVGNKFITTLDEITANNCNKKFIVNGEENIVKAGSKLFDFAAARNYATSLATNSMICTLDADEAYSVLDIDKLNSLIDEGYQQFEYQFVYAHDAYGNPTIQFVQSKFFDKRVVSWSGIVHEVLGGNAKIILLGQDVIYLEHWQQQEGDHRGNYLIGLALDCYQNPEKDRQSHYFARELMWRGRPKSAIKEFERHIKMDRWPTECAQSMIFMGDCYGIINNPIKQVECYNKAFHHDPTRREALIKLAYFYKFNNKPFSVLAYTKAALEIPWTDYYANDKAMYEYIPYELLYWAYGWLGNIEEAKKNILIALSINPLHPDYIRDTKFYFDYPDNGIDGWMTFEELSWLNNMAKPHKSIAELGSWKGRSTHAIASSCKGIVTAIDTWQGSLDEKDLTNWMAKVDDIFQIFKENTKQFTNIVTNRNKGMIAVNDYADKSFDVVFIDAGHTYDEVTEDIEAWLPKSKMIICGHDYKEQTWMEVVKAVDDKFGKPDGVVGTIWYKYLVPKVSFIIPTLGRPDGLKRCLDSINNLNYPQELIETIVIDGDDTVPNKVAKGVWQSKNDYIVFGSNDIEFDPDSLYNALQVDKALVAFNTGYVGLDEGNICEHFIIRKSFIKRIDGEIFDTDFHHAGCDNLLWEKAKRLGENGRAENAIVKHYHFSNGTSNLDEIYEKGWKYVHEDRILLDKKLKELSNQTYNSYKLESEPPKFSICIIAKNEEKTLPRLLKSLKHFISLGGDVVVLDTGSVDNTMNIAEKFGCSVFKSDESHSIGDELAKDINKFFIVDDELPLVKSGDVYFDFSSARNHVATLAKNEFILSLDADEILTTFDINNINKLIDDGYDKFEHYQIFTHKSNGEEEIKFLQSKFYDRRIHSWDNIVHEMLSNSSNKYKINESILKIEHFQNQETNRNIYITGLAVDCFLNQNKDRNLHYLARELFSSDRLKSAEKAFKKHLEMDLPPQEYPTTPTHMESMLYIGNIVGRMGELENELKWYIKAMELNPDRREPLIRIAEFYKWHKNTKEALKYANKSLEFIWDEKYGVSEKFFNDEPNLIIDLLTKEHPKVSIIIPTLGREEKLCRLLESIKANAGYDNYEIIIKQDQFPPNNIGVPKLLKQGVCESTGELIMFLGNDCIARKDFLKNAVNKMKEHFPDLDGLVGLNDGYWYGEVYSHWLAGKKLLPLIGGEFFNTGYHHTGCDSELTQMSRKLGKAVWAENSRVFHDHPLQKDYKGQIDEIYDLAYDHEKMRKDNALYYHRMGQLEFEPVDRFKPSLYIPRTIFTIWLNTEPISDELQKSIDNHKIDGFEHKLITLDNCDKSAKYVRDCLSRNDVIGWVKASDYLRLWYLYTEGGIYTDIDIEILKPFDLELLSCRLFMCKEEDNGFMANGIIGSEPKHIIIKACLDVMDFLDGKNDSIFENGMGKWTKLLDDVFRAYTWPKNEKGIAHPIDEPTKIRVYPREYFLPYNQITGTTNITENSYTTHKYLRSWVKTNNE